MKKIKGVCQDVFCEVQYKIQEVVLLGRSTVVHYCSSWEAI